jgi:hypothetical protein
MPLVQWVRHVFLGDETRDPASETLNGDDSFGIPLTDADADTDAGAEAGIEADADAEVE